MSLRVLELYCGIGGMHFGLERIGIPYEVVAAMDINTSVLETYAFNFPKTKSSNRNILSLTVEELNHLALDMIVLSPPCQPFCRSGLQLDTQDARTDSFCHLLNIFPHVNFQYLLLENVKGFEVSSAHTLLLQCLRKCGFKWQEFLLTPTAVGIPNSRLRYYLIGKREDLPWAFQYSEELLTKLPNWSHDGNLEESPYSRVAQSERIIWMERRQRFCKHLSQDVPPAKWCVGDVLENNGEVNSKCMIGSSLLEKYYQAMDIVNLLSTSTCCFTKSYGTYVKGTGSVLDLSPEMSKMKNGLSQADSTDQKLRFFTPKEVQRLMCFPDSFQFSPNSSLKQHYKGLGNSVNVYVVSILLSLLVAKE